MALEWPKDLLDHELCKTLTAGDVVGQASVAGKGIEVMSGLRVRMGINTGVQLPAWCLCDGSQAVLTSPSLLPLPFKGIPEDIFLHDVTEHVDYRGLEYDLAGEICDMAAGGQILMGPKTYQRCVVSSRIYDLCLNVLTPMVDLNSLRATLIN